MRKATGRKAEEIKTALKAAQISPETRSAAGDLTRQLDLEDLALLAEFDGDDGAVSRILDALQRGYNVEYEAERIRQERAEAAEHQRLLDELQAAGSRSPPTCPAGAVRLSQLLHDGEDLTPEAHATCPGRGAYFHLLGPATPRRTTAPAPKSTATRQRISLSPTPARPGAARRRAGRGHARPRHASWPGRRAARPVAQARHRGEQGLAGSGRGAQALAGRRALRPPSAPREAAQFVARQLLSHARAAAHRPGHRARAGSPSPRSPGRTRAGGWRSAARPQRPGYRC